MAINSGPWPFTYKTSDFDGVTSTQKSVVADAPANRNLFQNGGTIEVLFKVSSDGLTNTGRFVDKTRWFFRVGDESGGFVKAFFSQQFTGVDANFESDSVDIPLDTLVQLTIAYNYTTGAFNAYKDGIAYAMSPTSTPTGSVSTDITLNFVIGNRITDGRTFDGSLYQVRAWNRELAQHEIKRYMYNVLDGDEPGLNAYYIFNNNSDDQTANANNGVDTLTVYTDYKPWINGDQLNAAFLQFGLAAVKPTTNNTQQLWFSTDTNAIHLTNTEIYLIDQAGAIESRRTLGTGATQAAAGNHTHTGLQEGL